MSVHHWSRLGSTVEIGSLCIEVADVLTKKDNREEGSVDGKPEEKSRKEYNLSWKKERWHLARRGSSSSY